MIKQKRHIVDLLFSLALFCVFTATSLLVVIMGADVYQKTVGDMSRNTAIRTSLSYLTEKIHQNDVNGNIRVDNMGDSSALVLSQNISGEIYETWIYTYNNMLCEIMTSQDNDISSSEGQPILELSAFDVKLDGQRIILTVSDIQGNTSSVSVLLRSTSETNDQITS